MLGYMVLLPTIRYRKEIVYAVP